MVVLDFHMCDVDPHRTLIHFIHGKSNRRDHMHRFASILCVSDTDPLRVYTSSSVSEWIAFFVIKSIWSEILSPNAARATPSHARDAEKDIFVAPSAAFLSKM